MMSDESLVSESHLWLTEYEALLVSPTAVAPSVGEKIWREYGDKIAVEFPSPKTGQQWQFTPLGWVGHIALSDGMQIHIQPKVALDNLFRMWCYAYRLRGFQWLDGLTAVATLAEFYERLAELFAQQVLQRVRLGLQKAYVPQKADLPYVRGQVVVRDRWANPVTTAVACRFDDHTSDIPDNQILTYTLQQIARSQRCGFATQQQINRAYRALSGAARPLPFSSADCDGRFYTRLNQDYQPLHALCRFFLEHRGPTHETGDHAIQPFLVDMAHLYELFVAEWLKAHLPAPLFIKSHEKMVLGANGEVKFDIDLVLYDGGGQRPLAVLDTKYKAPGKPSNADINQIVTYAQVKHCPQAILIYPQPLSRPLDVQIGNVHVRSLTFALTGDLDQVGKQFILDLGQ